MILEAGVRGAVHYVLKGGLVPGDVYAGAVECPDDDGVAAGHGDGAGGVDF